MHHRTEAARRQWESSARATAGAEKPAVEIQRNPEFSEGSKGEDTLSSQSQTFTKILCFFFCGPPPVHNISLEHNMIRTDQAFVLAAK